MTERDQPRPGMQVAEMSETVEEPFTTLAIALQTGTVRVLPSSDGSTTLDAEVECDEEDPLPTISWSVVAGQLAIDVQLPESTGRGTVELTVRTPPTVPVEVAAQFARVEVEGRRATLDLSTSAGSIDVRDCTGDLTLRSKAAAITVEDVRAETILLETQAGSIVATAVHTQFAKVSGHVGRIAVTFASSPRVVEANTTVGTLKVAVPAGTYAAQLSGRVRIDDGVVVTRDAPHELRVGVTLGSARITTNARDGSAPG